MAKCDTIYLEGEFLNENETLVSSESLISLFTLQCCENLDVGIIFTNQNHCKCIKSPNLFRINSQDLSYKYEYLEYENCPEMIQNCLLPAVDIENEPWVVVGLSASLRHFLNLKGNVDPDHISNRLLGFRKGCLQACAEVSVWTKFCEVEAVEMLKEVYFRLKTDTHIIIPKSIIRYEHHLERPPILHNALKRKQENLEKVMDDKAKYLELKKKKLKELPDLDHKYAEGIDLTLADLLLYVSFSLCKQQLAKIIDFKKICPLVEKWLSNLDNTEFIANGRILFRKLVEECTPVSSVADFEINYPDVPDESLYESDPNRYKPRWRSFTHQEDIDEVTSKLENVFFRKKISLPGKDIVRTIDKNYTSSSSNQDNLIANLSLQNNLERKKELSVSTICFEKTFQWETFPQAVSPSDGELPISRLERKCQQLESMTQVVIAIAKDGDRIVDFCAGGGHLGILLAFCLPDCKILLVENKKNSLNKAYKRVKALDLKNVHFYQCNLDYFYSKFDIGVCLHACGVATDLVMQKCFLQKASFVCCPCCYGSLKPNHVLSYPRSSFFAVDLNISLSDYLILGHAADQTHDEQNPKTEQGKQCMQYVDFDRLSAAQNLGYGTMLSIMNPPECTPKNHILIGIV